MFHVIHIFFKWKEMLVTFEHLKWQTMAMNLVRNVSIQFFKFRWYQINSNEINYPL